MILSLACDTILIISQEALFCCPHRLHLFHSPQHSWGIRLFIKPDHEESQHNRESLSGGHQGNKGDHGKNMAYTRIHAIKTTVDRSIAYICNPDKTDGELFVSSYGCSARTAALEFAFANGKTTGNDGNLAHHLIQSFAPGEVSFEEAHQIGTELADRLLEGKYSYVLATHIEKDHVHNHIIFCATDNISHRKYNTCRRNYYRIRTLSDELCSEHHLSVIVPGQRRGKQYEEWEASHSGTSWKDLLRKDIDAVIRLSNTYDDFIRLMKQKGYEIKEDS